MGKFDLQKSEEVQEILEEIPSWFSRWGVTVLWGIFLALMLFVAKINYPETIISKVEIIGQNNPYQYYAKIEGRLELFMRDGDSVKKGDIVGLVSDSEQDKYIFYFRPRFQKLKKDIARDLNNGSKTYSKIDVSQDSSLGPIQNYLTILNNYLQNYDFLNSNNYYNSQRQQLTSSSGLLYSTGNELKLQIKSYEEQLALKRSRFQVDSQLFVKGIISNSEYKASKMEMLQAERILGDYKASYNNNKVQISALKEKLTGLENSDSENMLLTRNNITKSMADLETQLLSWENSHLLISKIDGRLNLLNRLGSDQYVKAGEFLLTVVPRAENAFARIAAPASGIGKVDVGDKVIIKLDNFPSTEYGIISGIVESISLGTDEKDFYIIKVKLTQGLTTTYNMQLRYTPDMKGIAEIVVRESSLFERIFYKFKSLFVN